MILSGVAWRLCWAICSVTECSGFGASLIYANFKPQLAENLQNLYLLWYRCVLTVQVKALDLEAVG